MDTDRLRLWSCPAAASRPWCRRSRSSNATGSTMWKTQMLRHLDSRCPTMSNAWRLKEAPSTFDENHGRLTNLTKCFVILCGTSIRNPLTPEFDCAMRRVLEKKIYRIFCFLDEDMDSPDLKTSQASAPQMFWTRLQVVYGCLRYRPGHVRST